MKKNIYDNDDFFVEIHCKPFSNIHKTNSKSPRKYPLQDTL